MTQAENAHYQDHYYRTCLRAACWKLTYDEDVPVSEDDDVYTDTT